MKVVILCGGLGTRIREETEFRPKPMVEVGGRPLLWHLMKSYAHHGHREFVLCLGYKGSYIKDYFLNYEAMTNDFTISLGRKNQIWMHGEGADCDFQVTLADTGQETMTGGRLKRAAQYLNNGDTFLMTYGDGLANVDIPATIEFHKRHGKLATVTVVHPSSRFGMPEVDEDGRVLSFAEKPSTEGWVSAGFFVLERKAIDYIDGDEMPWEKQPLERLAQEGQLMAYRHGGFFQPMDTYRELVMLNEMWKRGEAPWKVWR